MAQRPCDELIKVHVTEDQLLELDRLVTVRINQILALRPIQMQLAAELQMLYNLKTELEQAGT
jgi:hypothetical protein